MRKIEAKNIDKNVIKLIGQDWMLVTAGDQEKFNMMTASWLHVRVYGEKR